MTNYTLGDEAKKKALANNAEICAREELKSALEDLHRRTCGSSGACV
jgi:hypothetical protein